MNPVIEFENVHFTYPGDEVESLRGIDLKIEKGSFVAVLGHNGSGGMVWECAEESAFKRGGPGQRVTLKPGRRYDFSALVKADGVVTQRKSIYQGLTICVECYDANGKMMFYDMARPTLDVGFDSRDTRRRR